MKDDVFYGTSSLSRQQQEWMLRKAHSICQRWWFDKLDCGESCARQRVEGISFEEGMAHFGDRALMNVVLRPAVYAPTEEFLEVSFRSFESPIEYFLWIAVSPDRADEIVHGLSLRP